MLTRLLALSEAVSASLISKSSALSQCIPGLLSSWTYLSTPYAQNQMHLSCRKVWLHLEELCGKVSLALSFHVFPHIFQPPRNEEDW